MQPETTAAIARDLIRFDTSNYGGGRANGETEAAEYLGAHLTRLGLTHGMSTQRRAVRASWLASRALTAATCARRARTHGCGAG